MTIWNLTVQQLSYIRVIFHTILIDKLTTRINLRNTFFPKTGTSTNNSAAMGILMVFAGMVLTFGRKFRKVLK
nr:LPXTG cell wall anchor domain-containing protein [Bacillus wiedmannii]